MVCPVSCVDFWLSLFSTMQTIPVQFALNFQLFSDCKHHEIFVITKQQHWSYLQQYCSNKKSRAFIWTINRQFRIRKTAPTQKYPPCSRLVSRTHNSISQPEQAHLVFLLLIHRSISIVGKLRGRIRNNNVQVRFGNNRPNHL